MCNTDGEEVVIEGVRPILTFDSMSVRTDPEGIVAAIMPWTSVLDMIALRIMLLARRGAIEADRDGEEFTMA